MSDYVDVVIEVQRLEEKLAEAKSRLRLIEAGRAYDIALRPDDPAEPDRMDDIVVHNVTTFRAEQMGPDQWWVACYFGDGADLDELVFDVYARSRPRRIDWMLRDRPVGDFVYEGETTPGQERASAGAGDADADAGTQKPDGGQHG